MKRTKNSAVIESTEGCVIPFEGGRTIRDCIFTVRGVQVMVDWISPHFMELKRA